MKHIAFHANHLGLRGVETALYDYAHFNEELLGNRSLILAPAQSPYHHPEGIQRFKSRFPVAFYDSIEEIDPILAREAVDILYCLKAGVWDGILSERCPTVVHCVFKDCQPHGDVYAYVSAWLSSVMGNGTFPFVPHMVNLPADGGDLRQRLGIPHDAIVFGRHGGPETFDLEFAHRAVVETAARHPDRYFLFLNTHPFAHPAKNIIYLKPIVDPLIKVRFINTCDAMLHARIQGESFGLSIAEFSARNRRVITWSGSDERNHIEILGDAAILYDGHESLLKILSEFEPDHSGSWDRYSARFSPVAVMRQFDEIFIQQRAPYAGPRRPAPGAFGR